MMVWHEKRRRKKEKENEEVKKRKGGKKEERKGKNLARRLQVSRRMEERKERKSIRNTTRVREKGITMWGRNCQKTAVAP